MRIKMQNVRLSFPNLFQTSSFGGEDTGKYDATFLLDKTDHAGLVKEFGAAFKTLAKEKWKGKMPPEEKLCLKDGDETEREEQQGCWTVKASTKRRPLVIDRDRSPLTEEDNKIYAGCYVNAIVTLWAQDNNYGKRINSSLEGVQFCAHGDPFGPGAIDVNEFEAFSDDDEGSEDVPF